MTRDEALARAKTNEPITDLREVVHVLAEQQRLRTKPNTPAWYLLNRLQRIAMEYAEQDEERAARGSEGRTLGIEEL